jgi:hypothetical protein
MSPSQTLAAALDREIPESRIAEVLSQCLAATVSTRSGAVEPDHKTRLAAAQLALAYKVGRPVERQEVVSVTLDADASSGLAERLRHSPALRQSLGAMLQAADDSPDAAGGLAGGVRRIDRPGDTADG